MWRTWKILSTFGMSSNMIRKEMPEKKLRTNLLATSTNVVYNPMILQNSTILVSHSLPNSGTQSFAYPPPDKNVSVEGNALSLNVNKLSTFSGSPQESKGKM